MRRERGWWIGFLCSRRVSLEENVQFDYAIPSVTLTMTCRMPCRRPIWYEREESVITQVLGSIVVSIPACHAGDRGSIPRRGGLLQCFFSFLFSFLLIL